MFLILYKIFRPYRLFFFLFITKAKIEKPFAFLRTDGTEKTRK